MDGDASEIAPALYAPFASFADWADLVVDDGYWVEYLSRIKEFDTADASLLAHARSVAKRAAAVDTGAIEGLYQLDRGVTITIATQVGYWQAAYAKEAERVRSMIDNQLSAYDEVIDFATGAVAIGEAWIRQLHTKLCQSQGTYTVHTSQGQQQQALPVGVYKTQPNHVHEQSGRLKEYAPVDDTAPEMARFVQELRSPKFEKAHPVLQAAYAHYAFVCIHPFADGNGRVARALGSVFTNRAASIPLFILTEHRDAYFRALESADAGNLQGFVDFVQARCIDAFALVIRSLVSAKLPDPIDRRTQLHALYRTPGGYTHFEVDEAGVRLFEAVTAKINQLAREFSSPEINIATSIQSQESPGTLPENYRSLISKSRRRMEVVMSSKEPAEARTAFNLWVFVPTNCTADSQVIVMCDFGNHPLGIAMRDIHPSVSTVAELHIAMHLSGIFGLTLDHMIGIAATDLQRRGYS